MRKLFLALLILGYFAGVGNAAPPSRLHTYTSGAVISSSDVTDNEDALFNYCQAGVDTYLDGSIVNDDLNASANVQSDKLNLTSIAQGVKITSSGSFENDGTTTLDGTVDLNAKLTADGTEIEGSNFDINGGAIDAVTLGGSSAVTITDMDCNGGTLDGVTIGTETATGMLIVNNATDDADGLGSQGTAGQFLQSAGAGANPTWATLPVVVETESVIKVDTTISSAAFVLITGLSPTITTTATSTVHISFHIHSLEAGNTVTFELKRDATSLDATIWAATLGAAFEPIDYSYEDAALAAGTYTYTLGAKSSSGAGVTLTTTGTIAITAIAD